MFLHKQQSTDGQLLYSVVSSQLKMSTFWTPVWCMYWWNVKTVQDTILKDRRQVAELSCGTKHHIISDVLGYSRVAQVTGEIMHIRMQSTSRNLDLYLTDLVKFLRRYVTTDETCAQHFNPEMKDKVWSGSTQPHLHWSSFERPHRP